MRSFDESRDSDFSDLDDDGYLDDDEGFGEEGVISESDYSDLMIAIKYGKLDQVQHLLSVGVNTEVVVGELTAVLVCVINEQEHALDLLLKAGANPDGHSAGPHPLYLSIMQRLWTFAKLLIEGGVNLNQMHSRSDLTFLSTVADMEDAPLEIIQLMVTHGADVTQRDKHGNLAIHHVSKRRGTTALLEFLLSAGSPVNVLTKNKKSPLMFSVTCGNLEGVKVLLAHGANPNLVDSGGHVALFMSARSSTIVHELLKANARADVRDFYNNNCLHHAAHNNASHDVILALANAGSDPRSFNMVGSYPFNVAELQGFRACASLLQRLSRAKKRMAYCSSASKDE